MHHDHHHCIARQRVEVLSERSLLAQAVSDALTSCRRLAAAPRRRDTQAAWVLATAVALAGAGLPARAQQQPPTNWTGAESSDWFTPGNWSEGVPTNETDVFIDATQHDPELSGGDVFTSTLHVSAGALTISGGGKLSSWLGRIGEGNSGGTVTVTGPGSRWSTLGYDIYVGASSGGIGWLDIENGGVVEANRQVSIGGGYGSVGQVTVEGAGSVLLADDITVGVSSHSKGTLVLQDGGQARSGSGTVGATRDSVGKVTVTGVDSSWSISNQLVVGSRGSGTLLVEAGGLVSGGSGVIGINSLSEATVTGAGSSWINSEDLVVGDTGAGRLFVEAGGTVGSQQGIIGNEAGSVGKATVTGSGSTWTNQGALTVGKEGQGLLQILEGGLVESAAGSINSSTAPDGGVEVIGSGSTWTNAGGLLVGETSLGSMEILDGGLVESASVSLGSTGSEGRVRVNGFDAGGVSSRLGITGNLLVGDAGTGKLLVDNAGVLDNQDGTIGNTADSTDSRALVTGSGSTWTNRGMLSVGKGGEGILEILDGGHVGSASGSIGSSLGSMGEVAVAGAGSSWINTHDLNVGLEGSGALTIAAGGLVESGQSGIGIAAGSTGAVTVTGAGSRWMLNGNRMRIGHSGNGTLSIVDGAEVSAGSAVIGDSAGATGIVTVDGIGSIWTPGVLYIGNMGTGTMEILGGGTVSSDVSIVGDSAGSADNRVLVTGTGSTWTNVGTLSIGEWGGGLLEVLDGGHVESASGSIGTTAGADGKVRVSGVDSAGTRSHWEIDTGNLTVGDVGTGSLLVEAGGRVRNQHGFIGNAADSTSKVTVTGEGSAWINDGGLWVGNAGSGVLEILDRGVVGSMEAVVGNVGDGTVLVDGAGSRWDIGGGLVVGNLGSGQVTLSNGGVATSMYGAIGSQGQQLGTVLVQGTGSAWTGLQGLYLGLEGNGALTLADGGRVEVMAGIPGAGVVLGGYGGSSGTLNIGAGGAAGLLDTASITSGDGTATLNFNHDEAGHFFTNDGTAGGTAVLIGGSTAVNQIGTGTTVLVGNHDYVGDTTVSAGRLLVEGALGDTATTVAGGATLGGSGSIAGDVVIADGGILAPGSSAGTLTVGSLSLSSGSTLGYELGQSGVVGGGVNDLIEVTGDLALDGSLQVTDIGGFGAGVYRLVNYGGDLTDNGLEFGALPTGVEGADLLVQTAIDGQVNLVSTTGMTLAFWDGAAADGHNNDAIDGGDGTWIAVDGSWTAADGALNGHWDNGEFAVFGGTAGNVEVVGEQVVAGLQFMSGYTLAAGTDGALSIDDTGTIIRVDPNVSATIDVGITGDGGLVKTDTGTLVLSGENTYLGDTAIRAGTLVGDSASLRGNLDNDGRVVFDQTDDGTFAGAITGGGTMAKRGVGMLTLTGNSALDWSIDVGGLVATGAFDGNATIAKGAHLRLARAGHAAYAGVLSGAGGFEIAGAGTFVMTGNSAGFTGTTSLGSGTLQLDGALGGSTRIANGALLSGTGRLGTVDNHGTISPGNSIGTLMLTGDYIHHDDATLLAEIEPGGGSDLLDIAGSATIEGGTVDIIKLPGQYEGGTRYTLIDAAGGITGSFDRLGQDLPFLDLLLGYDANHVYLDVQRNEVGFDIVCGDGTFNQCQVAGALDAIGHDRPIPTDLETVLTEVTTLTLDQARAGFDRLSGEAHASAAGAMLEGHALYGKTVSRRLVERREATGARRLQGGTWVRGYGMGSELDGDGNAHGARLELYGLAVGIDAWASESWLVGASVNTLKLDADFRAGDGAEADAKNVALYTSMQNERGFLDAVASFGWWDSEVQRRIEVGNLLRGADSEYGTDRVALALEAGLSYALQESILQPLLAVEYSKLSTEGFREHGADEVNLVGRSQDVERTVASAGLRWNGEFGGGKWIWSPTAQARWLHTFGDRAAAFDMAFAGAPDAGFRVRGVAVPEDRGLVGIGVRASRGALDVFADVDYQAGDGFKAASFGAGVRWHW